MRTISLYMYSVGGVDPRVEFFNATTDVDPYGHARLSIEGGWLSFLVHHPLYCTIHIKSHICSYLIGNDVFMDLFLSEPILGLRYIFVLFFI